MRTRRYNQTTYFSISEGGSFSRYLIDSGSIEVSITDYSCKPMSRKVSIPASSLPGGWQEDYSDRHKAIEVFKWDINRVLFEDHPWKFMIETGVEATLSFNPDGTISVAVGLLSDLEFDSITGTYQLGSTTFRLLMYYEVEDDNTEV